MDVTFHSLPDMPLKELVTYFNQYLTDEIYVLDIEIMPDHFKNSMSLLCAADYMIEEKQPGIYPDDFKERFTKFIDQPEILVTKKTKKSEKLIDIKPYILKWGFSLAEFAKDTKQTYAAYQSPYNGSAIFLQLTSGSEVNIKPELVINAFFDYCQKEIVPYCYEVHRLQMYFNPLPEKKEQHES